MKQPLELTPKCKMKLDCELYWNINRCLSYSCFFNEIVGNRSIGKTTQAEIWCVNRWINFGEQFIYCRRYKTETNKNKNLMERFLDDTKTEGMGEGSYKWTLNKKTIGYTIPLSTAVTLKSVPFDNVNTIIYDEGILQRGSNYRYLDDEVHVFFDFVSTVFRNRTKNIRVFLLGNNLDILNPYNEYFKVPNMIGSDLYVNRERGLYIEYCKSAEELKREQQLTPLFALTKGTTYNQYAYDNNIFKDKEVNLERRDFKANLFGRLRINNNTLYLYLQGSRRLHVFVDLKEKAIDTSDTFIIMQDNNINYLNVKLLKKSNLFEVLRYNYYNNRCTYINDKAYLLLQQVMELFK